MSLRGIGIVDFGACGVTPVGADWPELINPLDQLHNEPICPLTYDQSLVKGLSDLNCSR